MPWVKSRPGLREAVRITSLVCLAFGSTIVAAVSPARVQSYINDFDRFTLRGNTRPAVAKGAAKAEGRLSSSFMLPHIVLHFAMTPGQQADLEQLLRDQQDRRSPQYHRFLTPEQYAARFGLGDTDIARILGWLREEGFWNAEVARSKAWVSFSGTAAQAESAFHITLRHYKLNGETYYANTSDPQLPKALQGIVGGVGGFHNFGMKPFSRRLRPNFTFSDGFTHHLAPDDWGTIYNVKPLWGQGIDGTGVKIAVVGQSDVQLSDLQAFRAASGLSPKDPTIIVPPGMQDPGIQKDSGDEVESDLDLEWAGAIAPNADIIFITASASAGRGVEDALTYAIDNNAAPIISISYGNCEPDESTSDFQAMNNLFQQANAQGITLVAASGDTGPAACDTASNEVSASHGYAVSFPASSAYVTGVGGTRFLDMGLNWATTNNSASGSALGYNTEAVWDDGFAALYEGASGGGASVLAGKPAWQTGTGVPADNARDVPDLAFSASPSHDGYLICSEGSCRNGFVDNNNNVFAIGGTSAPTPAFAGDLALVIQKHGAGGSLGNINPNLYSLAQFSTNIFHDVTTGSNTVPCNSSTGTDCSSSFQLGFQAGPGYDLATGWGSLDVTQFAEQWYGDFQIAVSPAALTLQKGTSGSANITLTPQNNFNGPVTFSCSVPSSLADVSCSIPNTVLNGSGTTTITINAASTAPTPWWKNLHFDFPAGSSGILTAALILIGLAAVIALSGPRRLRPVPSVPLTGLAAAAFAMAVVSCGGSSSPSSFESGSAGGTPAPPAPLLTLSCGLPSTVSTNAAVSFQCRTSGGTGALTFNVISGTLPPGVALNPHTGFIAGVTTKSGTYSFTVQVTDSGTPQQSATYAVANFLIDSGVKPVTLTCNLPGGALTGARYSGSCTGSGGTSGYAYSISAGSLPDGLAINWFNGSISGVPTSAGTSSFTVQVSDNSLSVTQTVSNFVVGIGPLSSLSCTVPLSAYRHAEYYGECSPLGGQPPFTYAITAGTLPEGLTLNSSTGVVSGIPLVLTSGVAPSFTMTVTDSSVPAQTASQSLNVTVFDPLPMNIYWPAPNAASLGVPFSAWCSIGSGNYPYTVSIISGQLPPGLQLDSKTGLISGTPTAMGTYPLTMQVLDSSVPPSSVQASNVITVGPRPSETGLVTITATSGSIVSTATLQVTVP